METILSRCLSQPDTRAKINGDLTSECRNIDFRETPSFFSVIFAQSRYVLCIFANNVRGRDEKKKKEKNTQNHDGAKVIARAVQQSATRKTATETQITR